VSPNRPRTRIQERNRGAILEAALEVFSRESFRGATLDQIAGEAGLSKPNLLYYFPSKEAIYTELLTGLLETWLDPLKKLDPDGEPVEEIVAYVRRKLKLAREYPRESRLFANEIVQGAPRIIERIDTELRLIVDEQVEVISDWANSGRMAAHDPLHLIFSIWATTQHYADFEVQVRTLSDSKDDGHFDRADEFLSNFYRRALRPA
jgi:TetR/AcrR family transcriptional regulator